MIESWPFTKGRSVTRSTESCLKDSKAEDGIGFRGGHVECVFTLFCWHMAHPSINLFTYVDNPGHQKSLSRKVLVQNWPAWPRVM